jgi:C1A family cysteine protease
MSGIRIVLALSTFAFVCVSSTIIDKFNHWKDKFEIKFKNDDHFNLVLEKWLENDKFIQEHNFKNLTYTLGHNQFSGMDSDEFRDYLGFSGEYVRHNNLRIDNSNVKSVPSSVNWITGGAVTGVKDQGQCGSCWSFSTTGALEGAYFTKYGKLPSFSEQQLVDCDNHKNGGKDMGCNGGLMDNAFSWIRKNGGLCTEAEYPYVSGTTKTAGSCQTSCSIVDDSAVTSFVDVPKSSDQSMMAAIAKQPVSVAIEADQKEFQLYKSGVFTGACGTTLDHGVLVVGYGTESDGDYYIVKNSWGTTWGSKGYIYLGRGSQYNNGDGQCGVLLQASYPLV